VRPPVGSLLVDHPHHGEPSVASGQWRTVPGLSLGAAAGLSFNIANQLILQRAPRTAIERDCCPSAHPALELGCGLYCPGHDGQWQCYL